MLINIVESLAFFTVVDYEGILSSKMLTSDENKSRMKTINSLKINNDLKIKEM